MTAPDTTTIVLAIANSQKNRCRDEHDHAVNSLQEVDLQSTHAVIADKTIRKTRGNTKCGAHAVRPQATLEAT